MFSRATFWLPLGPFLNLLHPASLQAVASRTAPSRPPNSLPTTGLSCGGLRVQRGMERIGANWIEGGNMKAEELQREERK